MNKYMIIALISFVLNVAPLNAADKVMSQKDYEYIGTLLFVSPVTLEVAINMADKDGVHPTKKYIETIAERDDFKQLIKIYYSGNKLPRINNVKTHNLVAFTK